MARLRWSVPLPGPFSVGGGVGLDGLVGGALGLVLLPLYLAVGVVVLALALAVGVVVGVPFVVGWLLWTPTRRVWSLGLGLLALAVWATWGTRPTAQERAASWRIGAVWAVVVAALVALAFWQQRRAARAAALTEQPSEG